MPPRFRPKPDPNDIDDPSVRSPFKINTESETASPIVSAPELVFHGLDGNECETFVGAIQKTAYDKGKDEDHAWMLRWAKSCLRSKALRWYAKLDPSRRRDWDMFVKAMFEAYPPVGAEPVDGGVETPVWTSTTFSPAGSAVHLPGKNVHEPAPNVNQQMPSNYGSTQMVQRESLIPNEVSLSPGVYDSTLPGFQIGRLRIEYEAGRPGPHYICQGVGDASAVTANPREALVVRFIPSKEPHQLVCTSTEASYKSNLSIGLTLNDGSKFHPLMTERDLEPNYPSTWYNESKKCGPVTFGYSEISAVWNILSDGTAQAILAIPSHEDPSWWRQASACASINAYVAIGGSMVWFSKDHTEAQLVHPDAKRPIVRARIVFEPIE